MFWPEPCTLICVFLFLCLEGKPIPTELRKDENELRKLIAFDDQKNSCWCYFICKIFRVYIIRVFAGP